MRVVGTVNISVLLVPLALSLFSIVAAAESSLTILTSFSEPVSNRFQQAFEKQHPHIKLRFINKKTTAALSHLEQGFNPVPDLFMASASDAFEWLDSRGLLLPYRRSDEKPKRPDYVGFAQSGYGFIWNSLYLQKQSLKSPSHWEHLLAPEYFGHIAMSSPTRSGTTHVFVESILQQRGWDQGWAYLLQLGGSLATITARSFGVRSGVLNQRFGIGLAIDFFAFSLRPKHPEIGFSYPTPTTFLPVNAGLIRGATEPDNGRLFIDFLLSETGQKILETGILSRYPINLDAVREDSEHPLNAYLTQVEHQFHYDIRLSRQRYELVNVLFDQMITFRLQSLQAFWKRYYQLSRQQGVIKEISSIRESKKLLQQAKQLATRIPFPEIQLQDAALLSRFQRVQPGSAITETQKQLQAQWQRQGRENLQQATGFLQRFNQLLKQQPTIGTSP